MFQNYFLTVIKQVWSQFIKFEVCFWPRFLQLNGETRVFTFLFHLVEESTVIVDYTFRQICSIQIQHGPNFYPTKLIPSMIDFNLHSPSPNFQSINLWPWLLMWISLRFLDFCFTKLLNFNILWESQIDHNTSRTSWSAWCWDDALREVYAFREVTNIVNI